MPDDLEKGVLNKKKVKLEKQQFHGSGKRQRDPRYVSDQNQSIRFQTFAARVSSACVSADIPVDAIFEAEFVELLANVGHPMGKTFRIPHQLLRLGISRLLTTKKRVKNH